MSYSRAPSTGAANHFSGLVKTFTLHEIRELNSDRTQGDAANFPIDRCCPSLKAKLDQHHIVDVADLKVTISPRVCAPMLIVQALLAFTPAPTAPVTRAMILSMPNHARFTFYLQGGISTSQSLTYSEELSGAVPALKPSPQVTSPLTLLVCLEFAPADTDVDIKSLSSKEVCDILVSGSLKTGLDLVPITASN